MSQIHILDGQKDIILDFITSKHIISDNHKKSLEDTLETYNFITFADKRFSEFLEKRNRIIIPDEDNSLIEFVIFEAHKYKDTEGYKSQVFSHASYLELKKSKVIYPGKYENMLAMQHADFALVNTGWIVGIVESIGIKTIDISNYTNPYEFLKRIAKEFDLELRFRIEHDGNKVTGRYVDLLERVGTWSGREVEFGKDLDRIRRIEKQDIVTALLGIGPEREDGTRLEVFVEDKDALRRWGRIDENGVINHLIEPYEIQSDRSEMTREEAIQYTRTALNKRINTQVSYECSIVDLENVPGMENKQIRFGDTIKIKDTSFNPPLYLEARIFEQNRSIKFKAKKDIKLGDFIEYTEEEVNAIWKQLQKEIRSRVTRYEMNEYTYDKRTIDNKDEIVRTDVESYANTVSSNAKDEAITYTNNTVEPISVSVENLEIDVDGISGEIGTLDGKVTQAQSDITQAFDEILLKVSRDEVISSINLSPETAKIQAENIELVGAVSVLSDITGNLGSITAGNVTGVNITGSTFRAVAGGKGYVEIDNEGWLVHDNNGTVRLSVRTEESDITEANPSALNFHNKFGEDIGFIGLVVDQDVMTILNHDRMVITAPEIEIGAYETLLSGDIVRSTDETGRCGVGGMDPAGVTTAVTGTDVNFRIRKAYTPSSVSLSALSTNSTPKTTQITRDGFWLYVNGTGTAGVYKYWRGTYTA